ncbi:biotin transporter BioY [Haloglycomyces albus]|uniref:biotin transporter BioY n=1 Tax=Haloglycomyces albus TaxID=526067 RepID=UPI00046D0406|nr:biotin transporter BioY [Haloglycomyces albus]
MAVTAVEAGPRVLTDLIPWSNGRAQTIAREGVLALTGAALVGVTAQIAFTIPVISPVPFTLQTFGALLVGASFGPARAALSLSLYLVAGVAGVPWFADASAGYAMASFGYIPGFLVAGVLVGALAARRGTDRKVMGTVGLMLLGNVVIYAIGTPYLATAANLDAVTALEKGVLPFLVGDALKILLAAGLLPGAWALVRKAKGQDV